MPTIDHTELARKYGGSAPRYTSYPTAPHFHEGVDEATYRQWLSDTDATQRLSVYVHVPYCHQLCWYCGCNTRATKAYKPVSQYLDVLLAEIALVADAMPEKPSVHHMHWGGGTPTILSDDDFDKVMTKLRANFQFAPDAEIAVEIDPRSMTASKAARLAQSGVTRASLGVQEFSERVQTTINRLQPYSQVADCVASLRAAGIGALSFDLMFGLPNQTAEDAKVSAELTAELRPNRVSVFGYAHVPWMKSHQRLIDEEALPGNEERSRQAEVSAEVLRQAGYEQIGLDHFALPDDSLSVLANSGGLRRNFQGYTDDEADTLIGFGASAIGSFPQGYVQNIADTRRYTEAVTDGRLPIARGIETSGDDRLRRSVIERLMCDYEVDLGVISDSHGVASDVFEGERTRLKSLEADGIITLDDNVIKIQSEFRPYVRTVCAVFDAYLQTGKARHSRVV